MAVTTTQPSQCLSLSPETSQLILYHSTAHTIHSSCSTGPRQTVCGTPEKVMSPTLLEIALSTTGILFHCFLDKHTSCYQSLLIEPVGSNSLSLSQSVYTLLQESLLPHSLTLEVNWKCRPGHDGCYY